MQKIDYYVLTQILIDDLYFPGLEPRKDILGGGCYTVAGMRVWSDHVGICSGVGPDFAGNYDKWFQQNGIHVAAAMRPERCTHSRLNYFPDGEREELLLPGYGSHAIMQPKISEIPEEYDACRGMYLFKDCDESFWNEMNNYLRHRSMISIWEILGSSAVPKKRKKIAECLESVDLFSLNLTEGKRLTGETEPKEILKDIYKLNAKAVILRMGANGALVSDGKNTYHIPAVKTNVVDVTGGGNSSTGGFLVGFCESGGDIVQAGVWASVAASFIIEQFGLPPIQDNNMRKEAERRASELHSYRL